MDSVIIILVLEASLSNILSLLMKELKSKEGYLLKVTEVNINYILPFFPILFG